MLKLSEKTTNYLKLLSTGIILIWLYIRSPFNPVYSGSTPGEWAFVKLNFIYWMLVSVFFIWIIYFVNKKNFDKYSLFIFTATNFLYISFYIFYGFDVLDTGFSLSKQWAMYHGLWEENFDAIAGTNLIGGFWLNLYGEPMLIWARLGFVIVQTLIVFISYKIMLLYFKPRQIFPVMLPVSMFLANWYLYFTINYDNLPFLFYLTSIFMLLSYLRSNKPFQFRLFLSGIFYTLSVFCKVSYIPAILLPVVIIILDHNLSHKSSLLRKLLVFILGTITGFAFISILLLVSGGYRPYTGYFAGIIQELLVVKDPTKIHMHNHSFSSLYIKYKDQIMMVLKYIPIYFFLILFIEYFRIKFRKIHALRNLMILFGSVAIYYTLLEININDQLTNNNFTTSLSYAFTILIIWGIFSKNDKIKEYGVLIFTSIMLFMFSFAGSDLGFRAGFHIGSGMILFTFPILNIKYAKTHFAENFINYKYFYYFTIFILMVSSFYKKDNLYREASFNHLTKSFEHKSLTGIKSSPLRVASVDSLLFFLESQPEKSDLKIFFSHSNVLTYYLIDVNYLLETPWDVLSDYYTLEGQLLSIQPDLFVIPKLSHRIRNWPLEGPGDEYETIAVHHYELYDEFIKENNYKVIYKNFFYTVWAREDHEADEIIE